MLASSTLALPWSNRRAWLALALAGTAGGAALLAHPWLRPATGVGLPEDDVCVVAPPLPHDPASGLAPTAARAIPPQARCPVCGMFPARAPDWAAQLIFDGGDAHFFDSPLSLLQYLHDMPRYSPGRAPGSVAALYVTDAGPQRHGWIDARSAWYVHGSDARGPMRAGNLPAFATRQAAQDFAARRGGQALAFDEVDARLLATLAVPVHRH
ncbi:Nitrous oxide reductase accessory protein NosL [Oryzisolibacter propanilivorax]|uniref:Nitrous oxide reductase accessory protein NosL n=1 Tax=Oryzisolibacter propanilivorax TaxID=1527607 RepID=A0A1G9TCK4_9BURK|nr:nitrous oxide reductase accessory protein NosL [Oryzisolibacter propanilivorax]SDM45312.1 Nitrous oxide reductase accessory protein NosL [Oryzisolibacter propanilivorax]